MDISKHFLVNLLDPPQDNFSICQLFFKNKCNILSMSNFHIGPLIGWMLKSLLSNILPNKILLIFSLQMVSN